MSSSIERLIVASQGVVTKHIDLALLECEELVTRTVLASFVGGCGVLLACTAWLAFTLAFVWVAVGSSPPAAQAALFGAINGLAAIALIVPALIWVKPPPVTRAASRDDGRGSETDRREGDRG